MYLEQQNAHLAPKHGLRHAYYLAGAEYLGYVRAEIDNKTVAVGFFDRVYPRFRDSIGQLGLSSSQQLHFQTQFETTWESRDMCISPQGCMKRFDFGSPTAITHLKENPD